MGKPITATKKIKRLEHQAYKVRLSQVPNIAKRIETLKNTSHRR